MATKPLSTWGTSQQSDATRVNTNDRTPTGNLVSDNFGEGNPNAQGPVMRQLYDATASKASHFADMHDAGGLPYPRVQRGAVAQGNQAARNRGKTGDDERNGPGG